MTWRVGKLSVTASQGTPNTWRVASARAAVGGTWRVAAISVSTQAVASTWRVARVTASTATGWQIANLSALTSASATPIVTSSYAGGAVDPVMPTTAVFSTSNGVVPTTWTFHLGTTSGGSDLDTYLRGQTALSNQCSIVFSPPGRFAASTIYLTATATANGNTSAPVTLAYPVKPTPYYYLGSDGQLRPMSLIYYPKG